MEVMYLLPGDALVIGYIDGPIDLHDIEPRRRWVRAVIVSCAPATWPLARLADGQTTEVRPFMTWRLIRRRTAGWSRNLAA